MDTTQLIYLVFGFVIVLGLLLDLGFLSKKNKIVSTKTALIQTLFWVIIAMGFFAFLWVEEGSKSAVEYLSAYFMEWSLSVDNIFVFIIIFSAFKVKSHFLWKGITYWDIDGYSIQNYFHYYWCSIN